MLNVNDFNKANVIYNELASVGHHITIIHQVSSDLGHRFHGEAHQDGHLAAQVDGSSHLSVLQQLRDLLLGAPDPDASPVIVPVVEPGSEPIVESMPADAAEQPLQQS